MLKISKLQLLNILIIFFILVLPYYIFEGKLYLGGDDTRLFYVYPLEFLKRITFFSWYSVSSLGIEGHNQYLAPFLIVWSILSHFVSDKAVLNYFAFSLPLILGFIFFQKSIKELFSFEKKYDLEIFMGSLFYILSPILIITQMFVFLISIYLVALIPIVVFYFIKYLRTSNFLYIFIAAIWCFIFSFALYAIPWLAGFLLPLIIALILIALLFKKLSVILFLKKAIIFSVFILFSQAFWITGFIATYLNLSNDSFAGKFVSQGFVDTFAPTVLSTATGNVFYPMLNLFHRQIAYDFEWKLINDFINLYDKTLVLNFIFVIVMTLGLLNFRKYLSKLNIKIYLLILLSFLLSLFFFTVNIGPLKELFILFGNIPGFTMFRNFQDKFALGFVVIYASLITVSLVISSIKFQEKRKYILTAFSLVILINAIPIKSTVNSPLWTTENIYKNIQIPQEYINFMSTIKNTISPTNNILSLPFGGSVYTVIKDVESDNVYVGTSPVKILSGVNDISGHYSFNFTETGYLIDNLIINKQYNELNKILYDHNINYIALTKNIPKELEMSYIYNPEIFYAQNEDFIKKIVGDKLYVSEDGNYELFKTKQNNFLIKSNNTFFKKISPVKYRIYIENIDDSQPLYFNDSYSEGWKIFLAKSPNKSWCNVRLNEKGNNINECDHDEKFFELEDILFSNKSSELINTHSRHNEFSNKWVLNKEKILNEFPVSYYSQNDDGSINVELILYFLPQNYFYLGSAITGIAFLLGIFYIIRIYANKKN
jgi:hypothetical protein